MFRIKVLFILNILLLFVWASLNQSFAKYEQLTDEQLQTLATLRKIDNFPLYEMRYSGNYGFEKYLQKGFQSDDHSKSSLQEVPQEWACTCFAALNKKKDILFGRNFDWYQHPTLILFTNPPDGYASVSMVDISFLGFGTEEPSLIEQRALLDAPYLPFDGMNECGLAVGVMTAPSADGGNNPQKVTISSLDVIRLLLDYANNVDKAVALLQNYNVDFSKGSPSHYLVSDSSGNSAVIEYINGEINVIRENTPWQVSTNFMISDVKPEERKTHCMRYLKASTILEQANGGLSPQKAMSLLKDVSQAPTDWSTEYNIPEIITLWSNVYNLKTGDIQVVMGRKYNNVYKFTLEMKRKQ